MILHDRVVLLVGGGTDPKGNPLPVTEEGPYPADVRPLRSSESVARGVPPLTTYYRLMMGRYGGDLLEPNSKVRWRGRNYSVQGDVEPHLVNGRLHHYEATIKWP